LSIFLPITTYSLPHLFSFVLISSFLQVIGGGGREGGREVGMMIIMGCVIHHHVGIEQTNRLMRLV
jgi:hypothetical protein